MARDPYRYFRVEARDLVDQLGTNLLELERAGTGGELVGRLLRLAHTLKGAARVVRQPEIADHAHSIEDLLTPFRDRADSVPAGTVEQLLGLIDRISGRIVDLAAPPEAAPTPEPMPVETAAPEPVALVPAPAIPAPATPAAAPAAPEARIIADERAEVDDLLDGVTEAYTQLNALTGVTELAARARGLTDLLGERLALARSTGTRADLEAANETAEMLRGIAAGIEREVGAAHQRAAREMREVRDAIEQLRLVPAAALFAAFERAARDSAQLLGKQFVFEGKGGDIRIDAELVRVIQDATLQLVRNAIAHGIEPPAERLVANKPKAGRVTVEVLRRGRQIVVRCEDDGRGIAVEALREAAIRKGRPADSDLATLLLSSGASTSAALSEVAGRGIGMDIVREAVARLGAEFVVTTEAGRGTRFELVIRQSLSSVEALLLEAGGISATVPLNAIRHITRLRPEEVHRTSLGETIIHDGQAVPLLWLTRLLGRPDAHRRGAAVSAIVVGSGRGLAALAVTRLEGTGNVVFRPLSALAPAHRFVAGASLGPDGNPVLMLDADGLVMTALNAGAPPVEVAPVKRPLLVIDDSLTTRMLEQSILESAGYVVDIATSGEEGLERARGGQYALILVDVEMPGMDGFTFIEHIRRDQKLRDTPAILVTSRNAPEDKRRGADVGANGYVVKSEFDQGALLAHIGQLVA